MLLRAAAARACARHRRGCQKGRLGRVRGRTQRAELRSHKSIALCKHVRLVWSVSVPGRAHGACGLGGRCAAPRAHGRCDADKPALANVRLTSPLARGLDPCVGAGAASAADVAERRGLRRRGRLRRIEQHATTLAVQRNRERVIGRGSTHQLAKPAKRYWCSEWATRRAGRFTRTGTWSTRA